MPLILYGIYLFLAVFNAGNMMTLQIQHYSIYPSVGKENFQNYMKANNKSALIPSILPAMVLILINMVMLFIRPAFMSMTVITLSLLLNLTAFVSTMIWQRKLQGEMAATGYDQKKISLLISTNWIRTIAYFVQAILAVGIIVHAVN